MDNVTPTRALGRRTRGLLQTAFVVASLGLLLTGVALVIQNIPLLPASHPLFGLYSLLGLLVLLIGIAILLVAAVLVFRALTRRRDNDLALQTGEFLISDGSFDGRYTFIRNINRRSLGYIDAVLIGPPGALVFRILNETGSFVIEGANWLRYSSRGTWMPMRSNPTREVVQDIQKLREFLSQHNLPDIPVFGIIVLTGTPQVVQISLKDPTVPVTWLYALVPDLRPNYLAVIERIPQQAVTALRRYLLET